LGDLTCRPENTAHCYVTCRAAIEVAAFQMIDGHKIPGVTIRVHLGFLAKGDDVPIAVVVDVRASVSVQLGVIAVLAGDDDPIGPLSVHAAQSRARYRAVHSSVTRP
jgi:hypothetical protein